ncbi:non-structural maintenance of chromosomes element 3 homolog isoform X2 [Protopterus annectens]|nr:non-structural maintenance of chromosomes element 3 homolog isoform X2 [Protopterus annectens]XP_043935772.1 non-structural maintenance of chromosomes element 3 homolog isoform X2 [Protopterus annectens]XP_043935773.1 non-structural maintenance of chromosomes element 3 homolog isoform X2 [Protopterus annectens]
MSQRKRIRGNPSTAPEASQQPDAHDSEDDLLSQAQTATQVQRNLEKLTPEQIEQKVSEVVQFILIKDQKKLPIKRADIVKNVLKEYKSIYAEILNRVSQILKQVFGLKLVEIDVKNHVYIVVNRLEHQGGDCMKV